MKMAGKYTLAECIVIRDDLVRLRQERNSGPLYNIVMSTEEQEKAYDEQRKWNKKVNEVIEMFNQLINQFYKARFDI